MQIPGFFSDTLSCIIFNSEFVSLQMDAMGFIGTPGACVLVEYINVRGHECRDCKAYMVQTNNYRGHNIPLSFSSAKARMCGFDPPKPQACVGTIATKENNFGFFSCVNRNHRCSSSKEATTQIWFGG